MSGTQNKALLRNQKGQGVIEYILVLILLVALFGGIIYQFNDAFKRFANNYFMDYIACLLETGELPAIGGSGERRPDATCDVAYEPFDLANGRPLLRGTGGGMSSGLGDVDGEGVGGGDRSSGRGSTGGSSPRASETRGNDRGDGSAVRIGRRNSRGGANSNDRNRSAASTSGAGTNEDGAGDGSSNSQQYLQLNPSGSESKRLKEFSNQRLKIGQNRDEDKEDERDLGQAAHIKKGESEAGPTNLIPVQERQKKEVLEDEDEGFSFGWLIKFLLIFAIIIALIIFLGGQALQISKSMK